MSTSLSSIKNIEARRGRRDFHTGSGYLTVPSAVSVFCPHELPLRKHYL